jgi:hypothetical protein
MLSNTTRLKGLYSFGNELGHPEGSMRVADNVNIDEPNVVTQRRGFSDYADLLPSGLIRIKQLLKYKDTIFRHYDDKLEFFRDNTFLQFNGTFNQLDPDIRLKYVEANSNFYFTTDEGIKKISAKNASEFKTSANYIQNAGVVEALDIFGETLFQPGGFLPPQSKVAYKVLFGKKDNNNNLLLGAPSSRFVVSNISADIRELQRTNLVFKQNENFLAEVSTVTCGTFSNTHETDVGNPDSILLVSDSGNVHNYAFWFNKGTGIDPNVVGFTSVEVDISALGASDNVAPLLEQAAIDANLAGITTALVGNTVIFTNTIEGDSNGVRTPTGDETVDIGTQWLITIDVNGTNSNYIEKYFTVKTASQDIVFYYGNTRTIENVPDDVILSGSVFVGIQINNNSSKTFVANQTTQSLLENLSTYNIELNTTGINPVVTMLDLEGSNGNGVFQGDLDTGNMEVIILTQGGLTLGKNANVTVSFTVPVGIDDTYFYQVYRTSFISVTEGLTLNDIDPGEEHNLVYEQAVDQLSGTTISFLDITPETFRSSGVPLYNNPVSGQGILQSNFPPPIAKDIRNYKGFTFYANTKLFHQQTLTLVSVDDIVTDSSKFHIINSSTNVEYTFRGTTTQHTLEVGTKQNTIIHSLLNPNAKVYLYSANDETKYVAYFDDGTGTTPTDTDAIPVRVDIADLEAVDSVATRFSLAVSALGDFEVSIVSGDVRFINAENGASTIFQTPTGNAVTDLGTGWSITQDSVGTGEDLLNGFVLLSKSASVGLKIERTARSLVNVINADITSPVNAYYTSSLVDLPGRILFKSRSVIDDKFYTAVEAADGTDFNPEIPEIPATSFTAISHNDSKTQLTLTAHEFLDGEDVYIYLPNSVPAVSGVLPITVVDVNTIEIDFQTVSGNTTDSFYFFPFEGSDNLVVPNRLYYSKFNQPEAVPIVNFIDIGTRDEPIERILSLRDYLFVMKSDGIFMLSGTAGFFTVRQIDTERIICPDSAVVLNNQIYMLGERGVVSINENSPAIISRMIEDKFTKLNIRGNNIRRLGFGISYEDDRAYLLWLPSQNIDQVNTQCYRYNILEKMWTRWTKTATAGVVIDTEFSNLYIADGDRPIVMQERKNSDRTDFADKDFLVSMGNQSFALGKYTLSSISEIESGDVITQEQYVTMTEFNRLLQKLDIDEGLGYTDFFTDFSATTGDNLSIKLNGLNIKLIELDSFISAKVFDNTDWIEMQQLYNDLIGELNNPSSDTEFKDYYLSEDTITLESVINSVIENTSQITIEGENDFFFGDFRIYKHIKSELVSNPVHFGNPSSFKQINKGYLLFDQNNFFKMTLEYATDLSPSFTGMEFNGRGMGFWGSDTWGFRDRNYWGGDGSDAPRRVIIPKNKQRCRYITVRTLHAVARDTYRIVGYAHTVREFSERAYR